MALDSTSTTADALNQLRDSADYFTTRSLTKAAAIIEACEWLLDNRIKRTDKDGESIELDYSALEKKLERAQSWYQINYRRLSGNGAGRVTYANVEYFRQ